jgi:MYXO-CTERM domain-containing protein
MTVPALPEPRCASPTDCAGTRTVHVSACLDDHGAGGGGGANGGCSCDLGGVPRAPGPLGAAALALLVAFHYKRRA